jgi:proton-dependent oligopeptide transporter, POT family
MSTQTAHPRGIYTLFFTEMWERMSYYGMRGLLILYMTKAASEGGMGLPDKIAAAIYGLYVCAVYLVALPGGWIADRLLGQQRAVLYGGIVIALGHFTIAIPTTQTFYLGLLLVVAGTGLLKPSASTLVGLLYPEGGARRDAGFTLFYMGVNLGAFIGPLVCAWLGEKINWHYGFAAAGVGMVGGVIQYTLTARHLGEAGKAPSHASPAPARDWRRVGTVVAVMAAIATLAMTGILRINPVAVADYTSVVIVALALGWFAWVFAVGKLDVAEKKRLVVLAVLFVASAMFWCGFEQVGSSMNLFADRYTRRLILGWEMPAGWFLSFNAAFVILFAPLFSWIWLVLARRGAHPSFAAKFASGLLLLAGGFLIMFFASRLALAEGSVGPSWLIMTYLLLTWGELALSPVGLSAVTKLAPPSLATQAIGIWFLASSLGNLLAGRLAGEMSGENAHAMPALFMQVLLTATGIALLLAIFSRPLKRLAGGVD